MKNQEMIKNEAGVFNAKRGWYKGKLCVFTHRDPKTGAVWGEVFHAGVVRNQILFGGMDTF